MGFREEFFSETGLPVFRVLGNLALSCVVLRVLRRRLATQDNRHRRAGLPNRGLLGNSRGVRRRLPFSDNRKLRPFWCIDPGVPVNCGHGRRGGAAETLVVGGGPRTGASARGSSGTRTQGADRARVGAPLRELREIRSGGSGANPKGACGEQYERLCLSGGHGSGEEGGRRLEARLASRR